MKENKIIRGRRLGILSVVALILIAALAVAVILGYGKLQSIYTEQCILRDPGEQVTIVTGKMVRPDVLAENLGLKPGANLELIDFDAKREEVLRKIPTLKSLAITRIQPDQIHIVAEERSPIARMNLKGRKAVTGRVVDSDGVVFICQRGTQMLPTIREPLPPGTAVGQKLKGRARAALQLIETCREAEFIELGLQEIDISKPDFLLAVLGDYSKLKITWEGMDDLYHRNQSDLRSRLTHLLQAIHSKVGAGTVIWNATMADKIFADTQGKL